MTNKINWLANNMCNVYISNKIYIKYLHSIIDIIKYTYLLKYYIFTLLKF